MNPKRRDRQGKVHGGDIKYCVKYGKPKGICRDGQGCSETFAFVGDGIARRMMKI